MLDYNKKRDILSVIFIILFIFPLALLHMFGLFFQYISSTLLIVEDKITDSIKELIALLSN